MSLSNEEKGMIEEALSVYLQLVSQQLPQQQVRQIAAIAQGIIGKLGSIETGGPGGSKPAGISDEWFDNVCKTCDKMGPGGCGDKVTLKFPGKCDPILHFERAKTLQNAQQRGPE